MKNSLRTFLNNSIITYIFSTRNIVINTKRNFSSNFNNFLPLTEKNYYNFHSNYSGDFKLQFLNDFIIFREFITKHQEEDLLQEITPRMKRMRYEFDHWDDAIHGFKEIEKDTWNETNSKIIEKFCGRTIAGLSLLTDSVMRFDSRKHDATVDVFVERRSLYIMRDFVRYDFTHEILPNEISVFNGEKVYKGRRIALICRSEPKPDSTNPLVEDSQSPHPVKIN